MATGALIECARDSCGALMDAAHECDARTSCDWWPPMPYFQIAEYETSEGAQRHEGAAA